MASSMHPGCCCRIRFGRCTFVLLDHGLLEVVVVGSMAPLESWVVEVGALLAQLLSAGCIRPRKKLVKDCQHVGLRLLLKDDSVPVQGCCPIGRSRGNGLDWDQRSEPGIPGGSGDDQLDPHGVEGVADSMNCDELGT